MIVIPNKNFTADGIRLVQLLNSTTKVNMLKVCDKLDLYVSPNLKKDETARRIAQEMLDNPIEILSRLDKQELQMVDEFVKGDANTYVVRKMRKTQYKLQKLVLGLAHHAHHVGADIAFYKLIYYLEFLLVQTAQDLYWVIQHLLGYSPSSLIFLQVGTYV